MSVKPYHFHASWWWTRDVSSKTGLRKNSSGKPGSTYSKLLLAEEEVRERFWSNAVGNTCICGTVNCGRRRRLAHEHTNPTPSPGPAPQLAQAIEVLAARSGMKPRTAQIPNDSVTPLSSHGAAEKWIIDKWIHDMPPGMAWKPNTSM